MPQTINNRFDEFQKPAVENVVAAFTKNPKGRYLLVIPTGGGKTRTAVKSVLALYERGVLDRAHDKVLWVAHRKFLLTQAREDGFEQVDSEVDFTTRVIFSMIGNPAKEVMAKETAIRLIVLDEAHHSAEKNVTYRPLLQNESAGILGLTATPSRTDGESLGFDTEAFSIGFPDLEKKQIIIKPEVRRINSNLEIDISGFSEEELAKLDSTHRNETIIQELLEHREEYKKIVVYVGTVDHAEHLCMAMRDSQLSEHYESIQYVIGKSNSRGIDRDQFLEVEKSKKRSIIVNVDVLTEGFDDPTVNTIVMARPTNSKLVYMQAMGRAIRHNKKDPLKKAYLVEIVDRLPNIRYRIDNRWLYADVSDSLEPKVEDYEFADAKSFKSTLENVFDKFNVLKQHRMIPEFDTDSRYSLLLFRVFQSEGVFFHVPIVIDNSNRLEVQRFFNYLSERMFDFVKQGITSGTAMMNSLDLSGMPTLQDSPFRMAVYQAMENASKVVYDDDNSFAPPPKLLEDEYWITFVSLRENRTDLPQNLLDFIDSMVNKDVITSCLSERRYEKDHILVRFPLPLRNTIGRFLSPSETSKIEFVINSLTDIKENDDGCDHRDRLREVVNDQVLPIEASLQASLFLIARENTPYTFKIS